MKLYSTADLQVGGTFRVHLGTPGDAYPLRILSFLALRFISASGVNWSGPALSGLRVTLSRDR